jgi:exodeoxyribonuclease VII small subunit
MTAEQKQQPDAFEPSLRRLEEIAERLESEDLELAEALSLFEEGVTLVRSAEAVLSRADARVQQLIGEGGEMRLEPLSGER